MGACHLEYYSAEVTHMCLKSDCLMHQEKQLCYCNSKMRALLTLDQPEEQLSYCHVKRKHMNNITQSFRLKLVNMGGYLSYTHLVHAQYRVTIGHLVVLIALFNKSICLQAALAFTHCPVHSMYHSIA